MKILRHITMAILAATALTSCEKDTTDDEVITVEEDSSFTLEFEHLFGSRNLIMGETYTNSSGEELSFTKVRYYVSNITIEKADGTIWAEEESYHIVDADDIESLEIELDEVPTGEYTEINFMIGVDEARNTSGAQDGALSPDNDMFWSWNSGYIFAKIEGASPASSTGSFSYHIGGFEGEYQAMITKTFDVEDQLLKVNPDATPQVHVMVDMESFFEGMHTVSIASMPTLHMPGEMALHLAHNLGTGIELDHIHE